MRMRPLRSFVWTLVLMATGAAADLSDWPAQSSPFPPDAAEEARLDQILSGMSLSDKVGQVIMGEIQYVSPRDARRYRLGAVLNGGGSFPGKDRHASAADWLALADAYHLASIERNDGRPAIPVIWGTDAVHGANNVFGATIFPHNIGLGAAANPELLELIGAATAREVAATGIYWNFAPTLAVPRNDRWGRTYEGYSEQAGLVAELGAALIEGMQGAVGRDFMAPGKVLATAKHFLGDGGTTDGVDQGNTEVGEDELARIHASGYRTALASGAQTAMVSFSSWNGLKMHANPYLLKEVLKGRMGFDGFLVGDWDGHSQVPGCKASSCPEPSTPAWTCSWPRSTGRACTATCFARSAWVRSRARGWTTPCGASCGSSSAPDCWTRRAPRRARLRKEATVARQAVRTGSGTRGIARWPAVR